MPCRMEVDPFRKSSIALEPAKGVAQSARLELLTAVVVHVVVLIRVFVERLLKEP